MYYNCKEVKIKLSAILQYIYQLALQEAKKNLIGYYNYYLSISNFLIYLHETIAIF